MSACRHAVTRLRCCVRDVRVGVTLSRQAHRHIHDLIAVVRVMIATPCPRITSRRRVAAPRRRVRDVYVGVMRNHTNQ